MLVTVAPVLVQVAPVLVQVAPVLVQAVLEPVAPVPADPARQIQRPVSPS